MANRVVHWEIATKDAAKAKAFYGALFDWTIQEVPEMDYNMVQTGGEGGIGGGIMQTRNGAPPYLTFYVEVEDVQATLDKAVQQGATACLPPTPIPGVGSIAMFIDPEQHVIGILQPESMGGK